jgi:hypothetical protein
MGMVYDVLSQLKCSKYQRWLIGVKVKFSKTIIYMVSFVCDAHRPLSMNQNDQDIILDLINYITLHKDEDCTHSKWETLWWNNQIQSLDSWNFCPLTFPSF